MKSGIAACALILVSTFACSEPKADPARALKGQAAVTDGGFRLVGEFEPMAGVWLGADPEDEELMLVTADLVSTLAPHVALTIVAADDAVAAATKSRLQAMNVDVGGVEFLINEQTQYFIRDAGAIFAVNGAGEIGAIDLKWSMYGLRGWCDNLYSGEQQRADKCASYADLAPDSLDAWMGEYLNGRVFATNINLEGGAIESNGRGTILVSSVLALQRNKGRTLIELEAELLKLPGVTNVIWMEHGLADDPQIRSTIVDDYVGYGTGGHTDEFVRFVDPQTIMLAWVDADDTDAHPVEKINQERMTRNYEILKIARDQNGKPFRIIKVPMPKPIEQKFVLGESWTSGDAWTADVFPASEGRSAGDTVIHVAASSYLNYVIANGIVVIPTYIADGADPLDEEKVVSIFKSAFPDREIARIPAIALNWRGGGLHCVTASEPEHGG